MSQSTANSKYFETLHQLGLSVSGWAAWKAELTWLENVRFRLQQLNLVSVSLHFCMYSRVFLRPKYTMTLDSGEVKTWSRRHTALVCVRQTPFLRAVRFLCFCAIFSFNVPNRGTVWLVTVAVQRRGYYKSLKMASGRRMHVPVLKCRIPIFSFFRRTRSFSLIMARWPSQKPPTSITAT